MLPSKARQTLGLRCDPKHPALAQFPTEYFQDWQWHDIVTSARGIVLDDLPRDLQPIVQPIDDWNTNRKLGLIFECKVGKGKLLVCAADLSKDLEHRPAARQLRASLLAYAARRRLPSEGRSCRDEAGQNSGGHQAVNAGQTWREGDRERQPGRRLSRRQYD